MPKITQENVKNASEEELRTRLSELRGMQRAPERQAKDQDVVDSERLRARAATMMKYDPETAQAWLDKARELDIKAQAREDDLAKAKKQFTPGTPEYIDYLMRAKSRIIDAAKYDPTLNDDQKSSMFTQVKNIDAEIAKYPFGRISLGLAENPTLDPGLVPTEYTGTYDDFIKSNPPKLAADGSYANIADLERAAKTYVAGKGGTTLHLNTLVSELKSASEASKASSTAAFEKGRIAKQDKEALDKAVAENGAALTSLSGLEDNPDSSPAKATVMTTILRKESGAAIAESEFGRRMQGWLGPEDYSRMINELTGAKVLIAGKIDENLREAAITQVMTKYLDKVPGRELYTFLSSMIPEYILKEAKRRKASSATPGGTVGGFTATLPANSGASTTTTEVKTDKNGRKYTVEPDGSRKYQQ